MPPRMTLLDRILAVADIAIFVMPGREPSYVWGTPKQDGRSTFLLDSLGKCEHNQVSRQLSGLIPQEPARRSGHSGPVSFRLAPETHRKER